LWGFSSKGVSLEGMTLEELTHDGWVPRAEFSKVKGVIHVADIDDSDISEIMKRSALKLHEICIVDAPKKAA